MTVLKALQRLDHPLQDLVLLEVLLVHPVVPHLRAQVAALTVLHDNAKIAAAGIEVDHLDHIPVVHVEHDADLLHFQRWAAHRIDDLDYVSAANMAQTQEKENGVRVWRLRVVVPPAPTHKYGAEGTAAQLFDRRVPASNIERQDCALGMGQATDFCRRDIDIGSSSVLSSVVSWACPGENSQNAQQRGNWL